MMGGFLIILACAVLYAIKGGQHGRIRFINSLREKSGFFDTILDGKILSAILFGLMVGYIENSVFLGVLSGIFWLAGVAPKMGRIVGDIGGYRGNWNKYQQAYDAQDAKDAAIEGWKLGLQRGVFMGAMLTLASDNEWYIVAGSLFPVTAWLGVSFQQFITGKRSADWVWHEVLFGAVIGAACVLGRI